VDEKPSTGTIPLSSYHRLWTHLFFPAPPQRSRHAANPSYLPIYVRQTDPKFHCKALLSSFVVFCTLQPLCLALFIFAHHGRIRDYGNDSLFLVLSHSFQTRSLAFLFYLRFRADSDRDPTTLRVYSVWQVNCQSFLFFLHTRVMERERQVLTRSG